MKLKITLQLLASLFVIQNSLCSEIPRDIEDVLKRLQHMEDKVAAQGTEIEDLRKTNAELKRSNQDLRKSIAELQEASKENHDCHALLFGSKSEQRRFRLENTQRKAFFEKVEKSKRFVMNNEGAVAFTAAIKPYFVDHLKHMDTIKFETVITDIGGGYNNQSGVFVAPVTGIYMFSCSLMDHYAPQGVMVHAEIIHNQRVLGRIFAHAEGGSYRDQGAQTVFTHVNQGDQIWVRTIDNPDLALGGELYSTFSGYLLLAM